MQTIIHINGDETIKTDQMPSKWYNDIDSSMSTLYNFICNLVPDNNWQDIVCDYIKYRGDHMEVYVTTH